MSGWRVFWHPGAARAETLAGIVIPLESRLVISEGEARRLVRELLASGLSNVTLRRPDSPKIIKGRELREWLYPKT